MNSSSAEAEIWPAPPRLVCLIKPVPGRSVPPQFQHQRPAGPDRSCPHVQHFSSGGGNQTTDSGAARLYLPPGQPETVYFRMAPKSVGLFVLFHLLALNVVSQLSAFPTPTASADGELAIASDRAIKMYCSSLVSTAQHFFRSTVAMF